jgi:hypothetical protein
MQLVDGHHVELWQRTRGVAGFEPQTLHMLHLTKKPAEPVKTTKTIDIRAHPIEAQPIGDSCRSGQFTKRRDDLLRAVGLWQKATAFRQVVRPDPDEARGRNDLDWRPSTPNKSGELQAVH